MDKKTTDIICYITPIGWIIAMCAGDREGSKFQLNQTLVLWIAGVILDAVSSFYNHFDGIWVIWIPISIIVALCGLFCFACWIIGFIGACQGREKAMPLFSTIKILK